MTTFYLIALPKQLEARSLQVISTTWKGHLWGQQWVIHLCTSHRLFLWWSILFNFSFFRSEDKNARSGQVATPKNSGAPPLGRTLLKHLYKYLKISIKNFTKFYFIDSAFFVKTENSVILSAWNCMQSFLQKKTILTL